MYNQPSCEAIVPGVGHFSNFKAYTFDDNKFPDDLYISEYTVDDVDAPDSTAKFNHIFESKNVVVRNKILRLTVPGDQHPSSDDPASCAEVGTEATDILYASVRTRAKLTSEPGVCDGMFMWLENDSRNKNITQEIDIEYLSEPSSDANEGIEPVPLQFTNQPLDGIKDDETHETKPAPQTATSEFHEYRVDWTPGVVEFYTDGVLKDTFTNNTPYEAGTWLWNVWTNGDQQWSVGPPKEDAVFEISEIVMFYNTTSD